MCVLWEEVVDGHAIQWRKLDTDIFTASVPSSPTEPGALDSCFCVGIVLLLEVLIVLSPVCLLPRVLLGYKFNKVLVACLGHAFQEGEGNPIPVLYCKRLLTYAATSTDKPRKHIFCWESIDLYTQQNLAGLHDQHLHYSVNAHPHLGFPPPFEEKLKYE